MDKITKEEARGILENYLVEETRREASTLEIRDFQPGDGDGIWDPVVDLKTALLLICHLLTSIMSVLPV